MDFALRMPEMQLNIFLTRLVHALIAVLNRSMMEFVLYYFVKTIYESESDAFG